jgi:uncharacterized protein
MKHILILADGPKGKHLLEWINKTRIAENHYHVIWYQEHTLPEKLNRTIAISQLDPTSLSKLRYVMSGTRYYQVYVVMERWSDASNVLKNIRLIDARIRIIVLDRWDRNYDEYTNLTVVNENQLIAAHLYDHLPNVPVVAQNVGLAEGEIMEILVPFGSTYAYRHVGSIAQRKWHIAALYRDKKQIIPTSATMIRPNDTLLVLGKPSVLNGIYRSINQRKGIFPEPFGSNLYLLLDFAWDTQRALAYLRESIYLMQRLENKHLFVRIIHLSDFRLAEEIKAYENEHITLGVSYEEVSVSEVVIDDIQRYDAGLMFASIPSFESNALKVTLFELRKLVYLFGDRPLHEITDAVILMGENSEMEAISATTFNLAQSLGLKFNLCNFDPEGDFERRKMVVDHYETLSHIFNYEIDLREEVANPVRKLQELDHILQISAFDEEIKNSSWRNIISTKLRDYLLMMRKHPKVLVPVEETNGSS